MAFALHPRLAADCEQVGDLAVSTLLLARDERFHWAILVPRIAALADLHDIPPASRMAVFEEIERVSQALQRITRADKLNVAALGNQVAQLHIHVIARHVGDAAWPNPVWSAPPPATPLAGAALAARVQRIKQEMEL